MKVSVVGLRGVPDVLGGVETHCEEVMPRIASAHPDIAIQIIGRTPYVTQESIYKGVEVTSVYAPRGKHSEAIVATFLSILKAARGGCDVLHVHAIGPGLLTPLARLLGLRVLITHHGEDFKRAKWNVFAKAILRLGEWLSVRFAHRMIAVSPSMQRRLHDRFSKYASRIVYIPNGMSKLSHDKGGDRAVLDEFGLVENGFILVVARLVPEKGIDYLIAAHRESGTGKPLVVAGTAMHGSNYSDDLLKQAGPNVIFTGNLPRTKLAALYGNAALFVMPSHHEGLPIAALEALSLGAPVLLSDIAANTDLGLPERHYFPVGDVEVLAQRLRADSFGDLDIAYWDGASQFDWDTIAGQIAGIYRELADLPPVARHERGGPLA